MSGNSCQVLGSGGKEATAPSIRPLATLELSPSGDGSTSLKGNAAWRLKTLEDENTKLKKLLAEASTVTDRNTRMLRKPFADLRMPVRGIVVDDRVDRLSLGERTRRPH
jgi:hypothetical protein